jgi:hypothetical protein
LNSTNAKDLIARHRSFPHLFGRAIIATAAIALIGVAQSVDVAAACWPGSRVPGDPVGPVNPSHYDGWSRQINGPSGYGLVAVSVQARNYENDVVQGDRSSEWSLLDPYALGTYGLGYAQVGWITMQSQSYLQPPKSPIPCPSGYYCIFDQSFNSSNNQRYTALFNRSYNASDAYETAWTSLSGVMRLAFYVNSNLIDYDATTGNSFNPKEAEIEGELHNSTSQMYGGYNNASTLNTSQTLQAGTCCWYPIDTTTPPTTGWSSTASMINNSSPLSNYSYYGARYGSGNIAIFDWMCPN